MEPSLQTSLGKLVRMRLMEQDRTLRDLAEHLGMTYQNLYAILAGRGWKKRWRRKHRGGGWLGSPIGRTG
ncbi:MAG: hypothetical protein NTV14_05800 [Coprothermobacterota bacterium]|nr:hypothetical protein [Coprothermobacterota bacterium]